MKNLSVSMYLKMKGLVQQERGAQSLEWLGIAALLIMIIGVITTFISKGGDSTIKGILNGILTDIENLTK